jgi:hypothetical protein
MNDCESGKRMHNTMHITLNTFKLGICISFDYIK